MTRTANDNPPPLPTEDVVVSVREYSWGDRGSRLGVAIELPEGADDVVLTSEVTAPLIRKLIAAIGRVDGGGPAGIITSAEADRHIPTDFDDEDRVAILRAVLTEIAASDPAVKFETIKALCEAALAQTA